jgi:hypothetical protein
MKNKRSTWSSVAVLFLTLAALGVPVLLAAQGIASRHPVPLINLPLVPDAAAPGGKGFKLTVNGTGFISTSVVKWNGTPLVTTFVNDSQLTAEVPASHIKKVGTASVSVANPEPGGGPSNIVFFEVTSSFGIALKESSFGNVYSFSVITADFNRDGKLDLAATNGGVVSVLLGNGDGTFQPQVDYPVGGNGATGVAVGDFNGDGKPDLVVATEANISVLFGKGDGTFQPHVEYSAGINPYAVAVADFNGDGKLDLAVADAGSGTVSVLLGNGDGTFQPYEPYPTGPEGESVAVGDFNGDGKLDLAVATSYATDEVSVLLGNGDGTFQPYVEYAALWEPDAVRVGDFNGDGKLDLAVASFGFNMVSVLLGNGDGTFQPHVDYVAGGAGTAVELGDINGDGKLDLAVVNYADHTVSVLLGNGDGTFQPHTDYSPGAYPQSVAVGDFNRDGRFDLAVTSIGTNSISILKEVGTVRLSPPSLDFSVQVVGHRSAAREVVLTNIGTRLLKISSIRVTGTDAADFSEKDNCDSSLPPQAHCTIKVTFKPSALGPRSAAVTITDNAPGGPQSVFLGGIGATSGANATLSTTNLGFSTQLVGTMSPAQSVTLSNYGIETLDITSIIATIDFSEQDNCGSSLLPGKYCTINVTFAPTKRGTRTGTVAITDNAPHSPQKVSLTGTGTVVKLDPTNLDFGSVLVGQKSSPKNTTLTNVGKTKLHITDIAITGVDAGDFSEQNDCPVPGYLGGGKSCTITVTFQPTQQGARSADVSISDEGGGSPQQVGLTGEGIVLNRCSGLCGRGCGQGCRCFFGRCVQADSAILDLFWEKQKASELQCAARPVVGFGCQQ